MLKLFHLKNIYKKSEILRRFIKIVKWQPHWSLAAEQQQHKFISKAFGSMLSQLLKPAGVKGLVFAKTTSGANVGDFIS